MPYGTFKSVSEVARIFDISVSGYQHFVERLHIVIPDVDFERIEKKLADDLNFINETTICERIISPILEIIAGNYELLKIWSHVPYNVDKEKGLVGDPDYLIAPRTKYGDMGIPPLCIVEAKKDNFEEGWTQALAEMVAASLQGRKSCLSVVTTGNIWEFGRLENQVFIKEPKKFSATMDMQEVFDVLNWAFSVADSYLNEA
ncbi:hypothetical protein [Candidatus Electronema sp. JM]|uniref:hypothetical protein n=1 Tax=Candidatus Electronema sp. JM TaxID=3401571 RepID=UPI003AA81883